MVEYCVAIWLHAISSDSISAIPEVVPQLMHGKAFLLCTQKSTDR